MNEHTWLSHDLPDYTATPESPPRTVRWRAQVFKGTYGWDWTHQCGPTDHYGATGCLTQAIALAGACEHMRGHG